MMKIKNVIFGDILFKINISKKIRKGGLL